MRVYPWDLKNRNGEFTSLLAQDYRPFVSIIQLKTVLVIVTYDTPVVISSSQFSCVIQQHLAWLITFSSSIFSRWLLGYHSLLLLLRCWRFLLSLLCRFVLNSQSLKVGELRDQSSDLFCSLLWSIFGSFLLFYLQLQYFSI